MATTKRRRSRGPGTPMRVLPLALIALAVLALVNWQFAAFATIGLLPTFVLSYTGSGPWRAEKLQCVAFCNMASLAPVLAPLWDNPSRFNAVAFDPITVAGALAGAVVGYVLVFIGPFVAAIILQALAKDRLRRVAQQRSDLIEEWGGGLVGGDTTPKG